MQFAESFFTNKCFEAANCLSDWSQLLEPQSGKKSLLRLPGRQIPQGFLAPNGVSE